MAENANMPDETNNCILHIKDIMLQNPINFREAIYSFYINTLAVAKLL